MSRKKKDIVQPEWSHFIEAGKIGMVPIKMTIAPGVDECKRLAKRMGLVEIKSFESDLVISRDSGSHVIFISGQIHASLTQSCVITAKPVKSEVSDSFESWYADQDQAVSFARAKQERLAREGQAGETPFLDESEDPEPVTDGQIDLGELVSQYLSLAIDPYPHAEGAEYDAALEAQGKKGASAEVYENPFAALKDWKHKLENEDS